MARSLRRGVKDPEDAEEDEGDDDSVFERISWFSGAAVKHWICDELSIDGSGRARSLTGKHFQKCVTEYLAYSPRS